MFSKVCKSCGLGNTLAIDISLEARFQGKNIVIYKTDICSPRVSCPNACSGGDGLQEDDIPEDVVDVILAELKERLHEQICCREGQQGNDGLREGLCYGDAQESEAGA